MQTTEVLFINAIVLTMDDKLTQYKPGSVAVSNGNIVAVGKQEDITSQFAAEQIVDCKGKLLMPGLINGHTHAPMTLLRGLADDLRLDVWLMGYMMPVERKFVSPEFVRLGTQLACAEMIRSGVTTFCDMYYFEEEVAKATAEAGMRAVCGETVLKFPTPDASYFDESLAYTQDYIKRWKDHPLIVPTVAPHAPYTCTEELLQSSAAMAVEHDVPLVIHLSETALEVENMRNQTGMPVIPYVKKQNLFNARVIAAHCVHVDEGEIRTLTHHNAGVIHNPSSNLKLASGIAPVKRMLELGLSVGLGTDGPASNNDLDMFEEMRLAAFIAKGISGDPTALPAPTAVLMATRLGAKALHLDRITGSIEPGKRADLILVHINPIHNSPHFTRDPHSIYAQIVYAAKSTDVTDVMINGQFVMRDKELLTLDEEVLTRESQSYARKIDLFLIEREQSVLAKLIEIGGATEEESFEVQAKVPIKDNSAILIALDRPEIEIIYQRHYKQYDTYFGFEDPKQGHIRFREDHLVSSAGQVTNVRTRLTHIGETSEDHFPQQVILSRSRFIAPAAQSLRFYREYFKPASEREVEKDRLRFLIRYKNTEFYVNIDTMLKPPLGNFLEVKSRTWSRKDAEHKARLIPELIECLGVSSAETISKDYIELIHD
ncbi:MAG: amidohydrolase family protein [Anaerolineales bacterium]